MEKNRIKLVFLALKFWEFNDILIQNKDVLIMSFFYNEKTADDRRSTASHYLIFLSTHAVTNKTTAKRRIREIIHRSETIALIWAIFESVTQLFQRMSTPQKRDQKKRYSTHNTGKLAQLDREEKCCRKRRICATSVQFHNCTSIIRLDAEDVMRRERKRIYGV